MRGRLVLFIFCFFCTFSAIAEFDVVPAIDRRILSPLTRLNQTSPLQCKLKEVNDAEEGCRLIRDNSWQVTVPFASKEKFLKLQKSYGNKQEFYKAYGLVPPSDEQLKTINADLPMGFSTNPKNKTISVNCFVCHGGMVNGRPFEGAANQNLNLQKLSEDLGTELLDFNKRLYAAMGGFHGRGRSGQDGNDDSFV